MVSWSSLRSDIGSALKEIAVSSAPEAVRDDLRVLRRLIVGQRDPQIAIVGDPEIELREILASLGITSELDPVREELGAGRWYEHSFDQGVLHIADLRDNAAGLRALDYEPADAVLAVARTGSESAAATALVETLQGALDRADSAHGSYPTGLIVLFASTAPGFDDFMTMRTFRQSFESLGLPRDWVDLESVARTPSIAKSLLKQLPLESRFALARLTTDHDAKREVAFELTRVASALNAAVASVPIPVAGAIPITTIQIAMIAGIAALSGRSASIQTVGEFGAAIGLNLGAAVAFREIARALVQWIPVAGPAISASIAAGATLTLGKTATSYYLG